MTGFEGENIGVRRHRKTWVIPRYWCAA